MLMRPFRNHKFIVKKYIIWCINPENLVGNLIFVFELKSTPLILLNFVLFYSTHFRVSCRDIATSAWTLRMALWWVTIKIGRSWWIILLIILVISTSISLINFYSTWLNFIIVRMLSITHNFGIYDTNVIISHLRMTTTTLRG
jgi:hypothetical protein